MADDRDAYFRAFEQYVREHGHVDVVLHDLGHAYFRAVRITGIPAETGSRWRFPHWAVVASLRANKKKGREAGNRVELVLPERTYDRLLPRQAEINQRVSSLDWVPPEDGTNATGHVEVRKPHNLRDSDRWHEDFEWFLRNLLEFQRVIGPHVPGLIGRS